MGIETIRCVNDAQRLDDGYALLARDDDSNFEEGDGIELPRFTDRIISHDEFLKSAGMSENPAYDEPVIQERTAPSTIGYRLWAGLASTMHPEGVTAYGLPPNHKGGLKRHNRVH